MDRIDTKFMLRVEDIAKIIAALGSDYSILEISGQRLFKYQSLYFDTPDLALYHMHHRGQLERFKVRLRTYVDSGDQYLEVKRKSNKKRTIKSRIELDRGGHFSINKHAEFIADSRLPSSVSSRLIPQLMTTYSRLTLANEQRGERVTIDLNLSFHPVNSSAKKIAFPSLAVVELKQKRFDRNSPFFSLIHECGVRPARISKYCTGVALLNKATPLFMPETVIKHNRFKPILRHLKQFRSTH